MGSENHLVWKTPQGREMSSGQAQQLIKIKWEWEGTLFPEPRRKQEEKKGGEKKNGVRRAIMQGKSGVLARSRIRGMKKDRRTCGGG